MGYLVEGLELFVRRVASKYDATVLVRWSIYSSLYINSGRQVSRRRRPSLNYTTESKPLLVWEYCDVLWTYYKHIYYVFWYRITTCKYKSKCIVGAFLQVSFQKRNRPQFSLVLQVCTKNYPDKLMLASVGTIKSLLCVKFWHRGECTMQRARVESMCALNWSAVH
jgi:hypothetical protein